jgi:uncharacterized protein
MTLVQMLVIAGAFVIAGVAKGALGMGLPPIAIGLMTFSISLQDSIAIMVLPTMATNIWQAIYGGGFRPLFRRFWPMTLGAMVAILVVAMVFNHLGSPQAVGWVGAVLIVYSLLALSAWRPKVSRVTERWANPMIGLASGAVAGITGVAAVPFLPYMQALELDRHELVQALGIQFTFMIGAITLALAWQGGFDAGNLLGGVVALLPTMLGVWLGNKIRHALSAETFRRIFLVALLAIGLHMARSLL